MEAWIIAACVVVVLAATGVASAQSTGVTRMSPSLGPVFLVDSTGKVAAKPLNESIMARYLADQGAISPYALRRRTRRWAMNTNGTLARDVRSFQREGGLPADSGAQ